MGKLFQFFKKKNDPSRLSVEILIDFSNYENLKKHAQRDGKSENDVLLSALNRGMSDYWLYVAKQEKERYQLVEKLFEQSKRDKELLEAIINQNEHFNQILDDENKGTTQK